MHYYGGPEDANREHQMGEWPNLERKQRKLKTKEILYCIYFLFRLLLYLTYSVIPSNYSISVRNFKNDEYKPEFLLQLANSFDVEIEHNEKGMFT